MTFVVEKDGRLSDIRSVAEADSKMVDQAIAILRGMPGWEPARNGWEKELVRSRCVLPFPFQ